MIELNNLYVMLIIDPFYLILLSFIILSEVDNLLDNYEFDK